MKISKIKITDEYLEKYEEDFKFKDSHFEVNQEIEVRIPFEGYYTLKIKCNDPQVAMASVLKAHEMVGVLGLQNGDWEVEHVIEDETYALVVKK